MNHFYKVIGNCYFCSKETMLMTTTTSNTGAAKLYFLISLVAIIAFLMFKPEWFWVVLPFLLTSFVKAKNWI